MPDLKWVSNRYLRATNRNFTKAGTIGNIIAGKLATAGASNAQILTLSTYFALKNNAYQAKLGDLGTADIIKEGASLGLKVSFDTLGEDAREWKKIVGNVYDERSPEYASLLPNGIGPFSSGKQTERLTAIDAFGGALTSHSAHPTLVTLKTTVDATYVALMAQNQAQKGKVGARDTASSGLELQRIDLCKGMLHVEAGLTQIFIDDLAQVDDFFPVELLRRRPQTEFTGSVNATSIKNIVKRKLAADEAITITNSGNHELKFYFAPTATTPLGMGMLFETVAGGADLETTAGALGASDDNVYLIVMNEQPEEGHWTVVI